MTKHAPATPQEVAIVALERQGWRFANWTSVHMEVEGACAVMTRKPTHYRTEYCEVMPDGMVV
jgi:hypothetical protein